VTADAPALTDPRLEALAEHALALVREGALIGLGAGRAATAFVRAVGRRVSRGLSVRAVPASEATATLARSLGIPLTGLEESLDLTPLDLMVDGADEVDPRLDMIKGYGGALARERIVAAAARRQVILVGEEKLVPALGSRGRLPVEVLPFATALCCRRIAALGLAARLRTVNDRPFLTDNGNVILDVSVNPIATPRELHQSIRAIPGVVDTGLFLGTASLVLVAGDHGVRELTPADGRGFPSHRR